MVNGFHLNLQYSTVYFIDENLVGMGTGVHNVLHTENLLPFSQISNIGLDFKMSYGPLLQYSLH